MKRHKVPEYDEDPSEEMIDDLNDLTIEWNGDECGLVFYKETDSRHCTASPGDVVVIHSPDHVTVEKKSCRT